MSRTESEKVVFNDGYKAGYMNQRMLGSGWLTTKARDLIEGHGALALSTWDTGYALGALVAFWREVDRGTEADRGEAGDSASAE